MPVSTFFPPFLFGQKNFGMVLGREKNREKKVQSLTFFKGLFEIRWRQTKCENNNFQYENIVVFSVSNETYSSWNVLILLRWYQSILLINWFDKWACRTCSSLPLLLLTFSPQNSRKTSFQEIYFNEMLSYVISK